MIFKNLYGSINSVSMSIYEELISSYVERVKNVKGVKSIVQIGSFTTPGLSDIDLIIIVDDTKAPKWEDISIRKILKGKKGFEVIAHDVFVYPESLSKYIEGLFYINKKKVLFGKDIGGHLTVNEVNGLKLILSFEYTIHRLQSLIMLTSLKKTNVRDILLFISTLRHTYTLLKDFNIITKEECDKRINSIEVLRNSSLNSSSTELADELNNWILPSFNAIYNSALLLGKKLNYFNTTKKQKWVLNFKNLVFNINEVEMASIFFKNKDFINKFFCGKMTIIPMPSLVREHIRDYIKKNYVGTNNIEKVNLNIMRYNLAIEHQKFINFNNYPIAKSYIIIEEIKPKIQDLLKQVFLKKTSYFYKIK